MSTDPYQAAGVDINQANKLVDNIKPLCKKTSRPGVLSGIGGFAGLFELPTGYHQPVLVSCTDGVGTKLLMAKEATHYENLGIDCVAMSVNDMLCCGAKPLFFLDYYACGKLDPEQAAQVIAGISTGCLISQCALLGGETAEMPGLYQNNDFDIAGFAVGVVEKALTLPRDVAPDDCLIGIASSGPHSNGFSLIRKIIDDNHIDIEQTPMDKSSLGEVLRTPTQIYVQSILPLIEHNKVKALSHITGGGLPDNIPRVLPDNCQAQIKLDSWPIPEVFKWLQQKGNINDFDLFRTFNCGLGLVLVCSPEYEADVVQHLDNQRIMNWNIGKIHSRKAGTPKFILS